MISLLHSINYNLFLSHSIILPFTELIIINIVKFSAIKIKLTSV